MTRAYRFYDLILAAFVTALLTSNLVGPGKLCQIGPIVFGAGNIFFPLTYILGDVLTEVYGYARARRAIWAGVGAMMFATVMATVVLGLPVKPDDVYTTRLQPALELAFGNTWRIVVASLLAFWAGDLVNSYVIAKMKVRTRGRWLWSRTIGSTVVGQGVDSLIFYPLAFAGLWTTQSLLAVVAFNFGFKVAVEIVMTPVTYLVVNRLKRAEQEDVYDVDTRFTPFSVKA
jgi:queuosine precursor transporter